MYAFSGGDANKKKQAVSIITWGILGFGIAAIAYAFVMIIINLSGAGGKVNPLKFQLLPTLGP